MGRGLSEKWGVPLRRNLLVRSLLGAFITLPHINPPSSQSLPEPLVLSSRVYSAGKKLVVYKKCDPPGTTQARQKGSWSHLPHEFLRALVTRKLKENPSKAILETFSEWLDLPQGGVQKSLSRDPSVRGGTLSPGALTDEIFPKFEMYWFKLNKKK